MVWRHGFNFGPGQSPEKERAILPSILASGRTHEERGPGRHGSYSSKELDMTKQLALMHIS